jgi:hypothetical protein
VVVISAESLDDPQHLFAVVGPKRSSPDDSPGADIQEEGGSTLDVGGFEDVDDVVGTDGPVSLQAAPVLLLSEFLGTSGSLGGLPNGT